MATQTIIAIEELAFKAWPALEQMQYDGWILRFANGYSKRINSVNPLYPGSQDALAKIDWCEQTYRAKNLRSIFRLTPLVYPENLEEILARRGYMEKDCTSVQLLDLASVQPEITDAFRLWPEFSVEWLDTFVKVSAAPTPPTHEEVLRRIVSPTCFGVLVKENRPVACGLGVVEGQHLGLFNIVVAPAERYKGFGRELVTNILTWALQYKAQKAYLQVLANNEPALKLYNRLGFKEIYRYRYRIKEV
jgi:ribosomal protein S18 acetylase RimI-like enzyme